MIAYQLWTDLGEPQRALVAVTRSAQAGFVPALRALIAMTLPLCDSLLLLHASEEHSGEDAFDDDASTGLSDDDDDDDGKGRNDGAVNNDDSDAASLLAVETEKVRQYRSKLRSDIMALLSICPRDKAALDICKAESLQMCEGELKKKVIGWLRKAVQMGCEDSANDLKELGTMQ
jgi:hypothetical protein